MPPFLPACSTAPPLLFACVSRMFQYVAVSWPELQRIIDAYEDCEAAGTETAQCAVSVARCVTLTHATELF